jgi:hypothetical protein
MQSERKQIPQVVENIERPRHGLEPLEGQGVRPRQVRYHHEDLKTMAAVERKLLLISEAAMLRALTRPQAHYPFLCRNHFWSSAWRCPPFCNAQNTGQDGCSDRNQESDNRSHLRHRFLHPAEIGRLPHRFFAAFRVPLRLEVYLTLSSAQAHELLAEHRLTSRRGIPDCSIAAMSLVRKPRW